MLAETACSQAQGPTRGYVPLACNKKPTEKFHWCNYNQLKSTWSEKLILTKVKAIKSLRERLFEEDKITFEIDSSASSQSLAAVFKTQKFPQFDIKVGEFDNEGLALEVLAR